MARRLVFSILWLVATAEFAAASQYYFPIIATGFTSAGSDQFYVTELVVNNPDSKAINGYVIFYALDGSSLDVTLRSIPSTGTPTTTTDNFFEFTVPANGTWRGYTNENGVLKTGWVEIDTDDDVNPVAVFSLNSKKSGLLSEASVFPSYSSLVQRLFGDVTQRSLNVPQITDTTASDTGIAIANTSGGPANVTIRLLDSSGVVVRSVAVPLQPLASTSKFLREIFPGLTTFQGTVEVRSDVPVAALGLRFTGPVFTTIPVSVLQ